MPDKTQPPFNEGSRESFGRELQVPSSERPTVGGKVASQEVSAWRAAWIHDYVLYVWALDRAGTPDNLREKLVRAWPSEAWGVEPVEVELHQPSHDPQVFAVDGSLPRLARPTSAEDQERFSEQARTLSESLDRIGKAMAVSVSSRQDQARVEDHVISWRMAREQISALDR